MFALLLLPKWQRTHSGSLTLTALDVGHGQAVLAQLPDGSNLFFDSGSSTRSDIGTRVVGPFLRYNGIRNVNAIIISHADIDHINGIPEIADNCRVKSFYATAAYFEDSRPTAVFLKKLIAVVDINTLPNSALIKTLWPTTDVLENDLLGENDKTLVILLEYAQRRILICSDIEKFAQTEILNLYPDLKADVLIAPHHGSAATLQKEFLAAIGPEIVICSCAESAYLKNQVVKRNKNFSSFLERKLTAQLPSV